VPKLQKIQMILKY